MCAINNFAIDVNWWAIRIRGLLRQLLFSMSLMFTKSENLGRNTPIFRFQYFIAWKYAKLCDILHYQMTNFWYQNLIAFDRLKSTWMSVQPNFANVPIFWVRFLPISAGCLWIVNFIAARTLWPKTKGLSGGEHGANEDGQCAKNLVGFCNEILRGFDVSCSALHGHLLGWKDRMDEMNWWSLLLPVGKQITRLGDNFFD